MENNLVIVRTASGGVAPRIFIDPSVRKKVDKFLARDEREFHDNPAKCVIPEYDRVQSAPLVKRRDLYGYDSWIGTLFATLSGWHFVKHHFRPLYRANSEGLRLIAEYGCPHRAYASLTS